MTVRSQTVDVILTEGVDTKSQQALVPTGSLLAAENVRRLKAGELRKREGYSPLSPTPFNTPNAITSYGNELVTIAGNNFNSYDSTTQSFVEKDSLVIGATDFSRVYANTLQTQDRPAAIAIGNLALYSWVDNGDIRYSLRDLTTNTDLVINRDSGLDVVSGETYRAVTLGNRFYLIAGGAGNNLDSVQIEPTEGFAASTVTLVTDFDNTTSLFDAATISNQLFISYLEVGGNIRTVVLNSAGQVVNIQDIAETPADSLAVYAYSSTELNDDIYALAWLDGSTRIRATIYNTNLLVQEPPTNIDAGQINVNKIVIHENPDNDSEIKCYWSRYDMANPDNSFIRTSSLDVGSGAGTASDFLRSVDVYSKPWVYAGEAYMAVKHQSELQSTCFVVQTGTGDVIAKFQPGTTANIETSSFTSPVLQRGPAMFEFALDTKGRIISEANTLFTLSDVGTAVVDYALNDAYNTAEANGLLYIAGGALHHYDGRFVTEAGFHLFPETLLAGSAATTGGNLTDGNRQYVAVYTWYDNSGNRHQSAPSKALNVTLSGGTSTQTQEVDIPTLRLTRKQGNRGSVIIDLYRTENNGEIFYKTTSIQTVISNNPAVDSVIITDGTSDADLLSQEILYTEGGVLDNISAPACKSVVTYDNRLFLGGLNNSNEVRYSKIIEQGVGIGFNEALFTLVPDTAEPITALAALDTNLIIYRANRIYVLTGTGPNNAGLDNGFTDPELLASDTGAVDARSLVLGPTGLMFKSAKGIYELSRGLDLNYVGAQVEEFNPRTVTSGVLITDANEIRFTTDNDVTLVYNYYFQDWTTFTNTSIKDSTIWQNTHVLLYQNGIVAAQQPDTYRDQGAFYRTRLETGWLKLQSIAGFQRVRRMTLYGTYASDHQLKIKVYTNYSDSVVQEIVFKPTDILSKQNTYGDDSPYGNAPLYGGLRDNDLYMFQIHLKQQKCHAMRFEIEDIINPGVDPLNTGEALSIVGMTLDVGLKAGSTKLRNGRKS